MHGMQQVADAFFGRQAAKVKHRRALSVSSCNRLKTLKVRQDLELGRVPSMFDKLVANELTRSKKAIDALPIRAQPFVYVSLRHQHHPSTPSRIAFLLHRVPKFPPLAGLAGFSADNQ